MLLIFIIFIDRIKCKHYKEILIMGKYHSINEFSKILGVSAQTGVKDLAVCSDKHKYRNINKTQKIKKLEKRGRRLQRSVSRKYEKNKEGGSYCKTSNIIKSKKGLQYRSIYDEVGMKHKSL